MAEAAETAASRAAALFIAIIALLVAFPGIILFTKFVLP